MGASRPMQGSQYRPDIDGLRALAVAAVVLFHLGFEPLAGGFVGVDVFFVISGFLITAIIARKATETRFGFAGFYLGRVRRIIPPLAATVIATFIAAAFILTPDDFQRFARSAVGALTSTSNIIFYLEAGYWDTASDLKPLLHTWSLGVEEQFYLVWPALVVGLLAAFGRARLPLALLAVTLAATAGMLVYSHYDLSGAFYLFPFRIFQFAAGAALGCFVLNGGLAAFRAPAWLRDGLFLAGLVLILTCILLLDGETAFPGWSAVPPTVGALLLLLPGSFAQGAGPLGRAALANPVSIWLGRVSYALYLVHWPVVSLYRYRTGHDLDLPEQLGLAATMLLAAAALHYGLERRFYQRLRDRAAEARLSPLAFAARTGAVCLAAALVAGHAWYAGGWNWRMPGLSLTAEEIDAGQRARYSRFGEGCTLADVLGGPPHCGRTDSTRVLFLGNSHEPDAYNFVLGGYPERDDLELVRFGTTNRCGGITVTGDGRFAAGTSECQVRVDALLHPGMIDSLDYIVYSARSPFAGNKQTFLDMIMLMQDRNPAIRLIVFGGYFSSDIECARILNETGSTAGCAAPEHIVGFEGAPERQPLFSAYMARAHVFVDRVALLCTGRDPATCLTQTPEGVPVFYDRHHLSLEFAEMSGRMYAERHPGLFGPAPGGE